MTSTARNSTARKTSAADAGGGSTFEDTKTAPSNGNAVDATSVDATSLKGVAAQAKPITRSEGKNVAADASARREASDTIGKDALGGKEALGGKDAAGGEGSASKAAATRSVAAAFVAARQKMAPPAAPASGKGAPTAEDAVAGDKKGMKKAAGPEVAVVPAARPPVQDGATERPGTDRAAAPKAAKAATKQPFKTHEFIVYPAHGVGQIIAIEEQEVAGYKLELFVISFIKDKMILKVPLPKISSVGMRKLADGPVVKRALDTLTGRARVKRTMWSRRAQEYEAKINSGDLVAIAEVVRDLYRSDAQPEQSYSERQLYEAALDRMAREIAAVQVLTDTEALKVIDGQLQKGPRRVKADDSDESDEADAVEGGLGEGGIGEAA